MTYVDGSSESERYLLLSGVFLKGPTSAQRGPLENAFQLPEALIPEDADEAAADHYALFGLNVFPFASVFLEENGMLGQRVSNAVRQLASESAVDLDSRFDAPDHTAALLYWLSARSTDNGDASETAFILDRFLISWFPAFVVAVGEESSPLYKRLSEIALELIIDHRKSLNPEMAVRPPETYPDELNLDNPDTSVRDIAEYLSHPARCGLFISRSFITRLGSGEGERLPHGFGSRQQMIKTILQSAGEYDGIDGLATGLEALIKVNREAWQKTSSEGFESATYWASIWMARLDRTQKVLGTLRKEGRSIRTD